MTTPWSIWCKESRMYIWNKQKFDTSQKALKNRWNPARLCSRSYWRPAGPSVCVLPSLLNSTTGRPAPGIPPDADFTVFRTLAVVLVLNVVSVSRYNLAGHSQRWHPPVHYNVLLRVIAYFNIETSIYKPDPANLSSWGWSTTTEAKYNLDKRRIFPPQYNCTASLVRTSQSLKTCANASCSRRSRRAVWLPNPLLGRPGANLLSYMGIHAKGIHEVGWVRTPSW